MITSRSRNEPKNKQQAARRSQSSYLIRGSAMVPVEVADFTIKEYDA